MWEGKKYKVPPKREGEIYDAKKIWKRFRIESPKNIEWKKN